MGVLLLLLGLLAAASGGFKLRPRVRLLLGYSSLAVAEVVLGALTIIGSGIGLARARPLAWAVVVGGVWADPVVGRSARARVNAAPEKARSVGRGAVEAFPTVLTAVCAVLPASYPKRNRAQGRFGVGHESSLGRRAGVARHLGFPLLQSGFYLTVSPTTTRACPESPNPPAPSSCGLGTDSSRPRRAPGYFPG